MSEAGLPSGRGLPPPEIATIIRLSDLRSPSLMELFFNLDRGGGDQGRGNGVLLRLISPERRKGDRGKEGGSHPCSKMMSMRPALAVRPVCDCESATEGGSKERATAAETATFLASHVQR